METVAGLVTLLTFLGLCYAFWRKAVHPHLISTRLKRLYALVQDWFDAIDATEISELDMAAIALKEKRISQFIHDHGLKGYYLNFTPSFRQHYCEYFGLRPEYATNSGLFEKYSKCPKNGLNVSTFWALLVGAFYEFCLGTQFNWNFSAFV